jgi:uncharacterized membrane protein
MFSSQRTARRLGLAATVLFGLAAGATLARAESIKPQDIEETRQTCMVSCIEKTGNETGCKAFCDCSTEGMAAQITQEEYDAGKNAIASHQQPPLATVEKLTAISKSCRPKLENN